MKKIIIILSLFAFLLPPVYAQVPQTNLTAEAKTALIAELKIKVADLMNQLALLLKTQTTASTSPKSTPASYSWAELEIKYLTEADFKSWTTVSITNPSLAEVRYYKKENAQWVRKNSEAELFQTNVSQTIRDQANKAMAGIETINNNLEKLESNCRKAFQDSDNELERLHKLLGGTDHYEIMGEISSQEGYERLLGDECISKKIKMLDGLIAGMRMIQIPGLFPDNNTIASTQLLNTLLEQRQQLINMQNQMFSANQARENNLELSQLRSEISSLKSSLSKTILPLPSLTSPLPVSVPPLKWNVQWTGGGRGFIRDSSGQTTYFQCDNLLGRCFSL